MLNIIINIINIENRIIWNCFYKTLKVKNEMQQPDSFRKLSRSLQFWNPIITQANFNIKDNWRIDNSFIPKFII